MSLTLSRGLLRGLLDVVHEEVDLVAGCFPEELLEVSKLLSLRYQLETLVGHHSFALRVVFELLLLVLALALTRMFLFQEDIRSSVALFSFLEALSEVIGSRLFNALKGFRV